MHETAAVDPDAVFAALNGRLRAKFTFRSFDRSTLDSVGVFDALGRPWFHIDLANGRYHINLYSSTAASPAHEPQVTLLCTDGSGFPNQRKDWKSGELMCAEGAVAWGACDPASQPPNSNE